MIAICSKLRPARPRLLRIASAFALLWVAGCGFPPPESGAERAASADCRDDANRMYNAQNRYLLSERDSPDTPFSGSTPPPLPSDGLSERYGFDQMVDNCLKHSSAVPVTGPAN
jgi:hypothetical protein